MNLKAYKTYLKSKHYKPSTITEDCLNMDRFTKWLKPENSEELEQVTTPQIVEYVNHLQQKQLAATTINIRLRSIRKYYDYLKSESRIATNSVEEVKVKGAVKKVIIDPLDYSDLEELYKDYATYLKEKPVREKKQLIASTRKKAIVSLLVFQGLHVGDLQKLEVNHLNLEDGIIYIPYSYNSQPRELRLQPSQIIMLFNYVNTLSKEQSYLFNCSVKDRLNTIVKELRGLNEKVQNAAHIRASVIMHWLKLHGKRQTQYMIGHKWISSTEYYELQDLEALTNLLDKYHPLATG